MTWRFEESILPLPGDAGGPATPAQGQHFALMACHPAVDAVRPRWNPAPMTTIGRKSSILFSSVLACLAVLIPATGAKGAVTPVKVVAGGAATCALLSDGRIACWGTQSKDVGPPQTNSTPTLVSGISDATDLAGGEPFCAVVSGGAVRCWGANNYGQLGNGTTTHSETPVTVSGITGATKVAVAGNSACALMTNGTAKCWGYNFQGQLGNGHDQAGQDSSVPVSVIGLSGASSIIGGGYSFCALMGNATTKCWGWNGDGEFGVATLLQNDYTSATPAFTGLSAVNSIASGYFHTCVVAGDSTVHCAGWDDSCMLGDLHPGCSSGGIFTTHGSDPTQVIGIDDAVAVSSTGMHSCALQATTGVKCWGAGSWGQIGGGYTNTGAYAQAVKDVTGAALTGFTQISAGGNHTCGIRSSDGIWCWGEGDYGQNGPLGTITTVNPVKVTLPDFPPAGPGPATITSSLPRFSNSTTAKVSFVGPAGTPVTFKCSLDAGAMAPCTSPKSFTHLTEGSHTFSVLSVKNGVPSSTTVATTTTVDLTKPTLASPASGTGTKVGRTTVYSLHPNADVSGIVSVEWSTATHAPLSTARPTATHTKPYATPITLGSTSIHWLRIKDGAGNWSGWFAG